MPDELFPFADERPTDFEPEDIESIEPIVEPFDPSKINVSREPMTIFQAMRKIEIEEIKLDPEFQRNLVWDAKRQSRLIESILLKIPLPALYLDAIEPDQWLVVDGLQRLSTLDHFCNKKKLRLSNLEFLGKQFDGLGFDQLPRASQRVIEETHLTLYIIRPETPPKVKFTIFHRINTGGMVLTAQEIRHATFPGRAPGLLRELSLRQEFRAATSFSANPKRMDDRELILRFLAFRITPFDRYTRPDLNDFLGSAMDYLNKCDEREVAHLKEEFKKSMLICYEIFGPYAFRKFDRMESKRGPINKALFETWSTAVLDYPQSEIENLGVEITTLLEIALREDQDYTKALSLATGGVNPVRLRFSRAHQLIMKALNDD